MTDAVINPRPCFPKKRIAAAGAVICIIISLFLAVCTSFDDWEQEYTAYPLEYSIDGYSPYVQQFDAFHKGQLYLDVEPGEDLLGLENPYNTADRENMFYLWDRAFYNGRYYSYFGVTPIFTVYEPWYAVTGHLPTGAQVLSVFSIITSLVLPFCISYLAAMINPHLPKWFVLLLEISITPATFIYLLQRGISRFYYIASAAGIAFLSLFILCLMFAWQSEKRRGLWLFFSGICFGLVFHSRVNMAVIPGVLSAAACVWHLASSAAKKQTKQCLKNLVCIGVPVVISVALSFVYNYLRFGSPAEFGTSYQLTVADVSTYSLSLSGIKPALRHYFTQFFVRGDSFPYFHFDNRVFPKKEATAYIDQCVGAFIFPLNSLILLTPVNFFYKDKKVSTKLFTLLWLLLIPALAVANYCLGGVIFRYTADIALPCALLSLVNVCFLSVKLKDNALKGAYFGSLIALCTANILMLALTLVLKSGNLTDVMEQLKMMCG